MFTGTVGSGFGNQPVDFEITSLKLQIIKTAVQYTSTILRFRMDSRTHTATWVSSITTGWVCQRGGK